MSVPNMDPKIGFSDCYLTLHNHSFASFKYFFDRVEDSENIERVLSESSTRSKNTKNSRNYGCAKSDLAPQVGPYRVAKIY